MKIFFEAHLQERMQQKEVTTAKFLSHCAFLSSVFSKAGVHLFWIYKSLSKQYCCCNKNTK